MQSWKITLETQNVVAHSKHKMLWHTVNTTCCGTFEFTLCQNVLYLLCATTFCVYYVPQHFVMVIDSHTRICSLIFVGNFFFRRRNFFSPAKYFFSAAKFFWSAKNIWLAKFFFAGEILLFAGEIFFSAAKFFFAAEIFFRCRNFFCAV